LDLLYIDPDPPTTYDYYTGLYRSLKKIANCRLAENVDDLDNIDAVVFGLSFLRKPREVIKVDIPTFCFVHKLGSDTERKIKWCNDSNITRVLSSVPINKYKERFNSKMIQFGYGADEYDNDYEKIYDVGFSGALHRPNNDLRYNVQELLKKQKDLNCFLRGSDSVADRIESYAEYRKTISQTKIWMATTSYDNDVTPRYYEVIASKTLLFCNEIPEEYSEVFTDGFNCVTFNMDNFLQKLWFYLQCADKRKDIVERAYLDFITNHTWKRRAGQLVSIINAAL